MFTKLKIWYFFHNKSIPLKHRWINHYLVLGMIIQLVIWTLFVLCIYSNLKSTNWDYGMIWYGTLQFFTNESNILVGIFTFAYFFKADAKIFKNGVFISAVMTYIAIVWFGFNAFLLPGAIYQVASTSNYLLLDDLGKGVSNILRHVFTHEFNPIYFFILFKVLTRRRILHNEYSGGKFFSFWVVDMIFPTIYLVYVSLIPWLTAGPNGRNMSVYNIFTNTCPNCFYESTNGVVSSARPGSYWTFGIIALFFIIFLLVSRYFLWCTTENSIVYKTNRFVASTANLELIEKQLLDLKAKTKSNKKNMKILKKQQRKQNKKIVSNYSSSVKFLIFSILSFL